MRRGPLPGKPRFLIHLAPTAVTLPDFLSFLKYALLLILPAEHFNLLVLVKRAALRLI